MTYHDDHRLSASKLKNYLKHDPSIAFHMESHPTPPTEAMKLGTAFHSLMEGVEVAVSPFDDYRSKEAKAWRDEHPDAIKQADYDQIHAMHLSMVRGLERVDLLHRYMAGYKEAEIYTDTHKAKIDCLCSDVILDWKTTNATTQAEVLRTIEYEHWLLQASLYCQLAKKDRFIFCVVSKTEPHPVWFVEVSRSLHSGSVLVNRAEMIRSNYLSGMNTGIVDYDRRSED